MADTKISALTDGTTAAATDRIPVVRDPTGTPVNRWISPGYIRTYIIGTANTWTAVQTFSGAITGGSNVIEQRNGTSAQLYYNYNTYTDASNYERLAFGYASNTGYIDTAAAGTGTVRNFEIRRAGVSYIQITSSRVFFGATATMAAATQFTFSDGTDFNRGFVGVTGEKAIKVTDGSTAGGALQFQEMTAPAAPSTNLCMLYAEDTGGGKTRLVVRFPTGAAQVIATEP